ncbi:hypothetical protein P4S72_18780 [Vibrio sp. PP-XX7]
MNRCLPVRDGMPRLWHQYQQVQHWRIGSASTQASALVMEELS